jgi:alkylation response protein AidB-like acyl-CoA dehydrogenase
VIVDLEFTEEEAGLRDSVRDIIEGISPPSVVRAIFEDEGDASDVWRQMVELDWPGLAIAEEHGGVGMGFLELAIVAEQLGRAVVPGPFLATSTQFAPAVRELGDAAAQARILPTVAAGQMTGTIAVAERGSWRLDDLGTGATATASGDGWRLAGRKEAVLDGATADAVVVLARADAGVGAFLLTREQLTAEARTTLDPTLPLADLVLDGVEVSGDAVLAAPGPDVEAKARRVLEEATVILAMSTAATCREIFDVTLAYAKEREQYGRVIGSFQALKHRFANLFLSVERASSVCWFAALTIAEDHERRGEATAIAKAAAGECAQLLVTDGLQLHGGIGFTWEHDLHFLLKRAKAGDALFGNAYAQRSVLAEILGVAA